MLGIKTLRRWTSIYSSPLFNNNTDLEESFQKTSARFKFEKDFEPGDKIVIRPSSGFDSSLSMMAIKTDRSRKECLTMAIKIGMKVLDETISGECTYYYQERGSDTLVEILPPKKVK